MDRRSFLRTSALGGTAAATTLAAPAIAQNRRTLTMVTSWPRGFPGLHDAAEHVADLITAMSDGALTVEVRAAGELVGAFEVFDAVGSGQADMYHASDYYFVNQHPAYAMYSSIPFGMTAPELAAWYYHDGGRELHDELGEIFNLKSFLAGNTGAQAGGWFNKEINSPEDFSGLRFRMPGLGGEVLSKLGASIQNLPGGEIYQALASGAIDAAEFVGPWADESAGFAEVADYYYVSGFHEPGPGLSVATNRELFESLSPAHQKIIETVAGESYNWHYAQYLSQNGAALQRLVASGVQVKEFPDSVWDAFGTATRDLYDEYTAEPLFKKIFASMQASMAVSSKWIAMSEGAYTEQRNRIFG